MKNQDIDNSQPFYVGNAEMDDVRESGWFVGQFVPPALGLRHQNDVELKWGIHADGERRARPVAHAAGTTISVLIEGAISITFHTADRPQEVTLRNKGDYVVFPPGVMHSWLAIGHTIVLSIRFPSVEKGQPERPVSEAEAGL